ncbi:hypothetical protein [Streptomyces huiliensis]|uniref:hypothetical protein n=1 Tax=Streptomyces huiliensis TaxID=2876027 RepID=UPI001CBD0AB8|nr:hypothetical protein [Streptomyces huiliensis]MBZ4320752.1 hypothetical protein [Streptomyces huiliensis]
MTRTGRRIGKETVADLRRRVHALRLADDVVAGGDLMRPAVRELRAAVRMCRLVVALADAGEPEEAAATADRVIELSRASASERVTRRVEVMRRALRR